VLICLFVTTVFPICVSAGDEPKVQYFRPGTLPRVTLVPIIQGPKSCVLVIKLSNQKVDLHRIEQCGNLISFRLLSRSALLQDLRTDQLPVLKHLEAYQDKR
jgi:hypothetical protein